MYEAFYKLKAEPFRLSPDHRFCFSHRSYAKAKAYLQYGLHRAEGFVMVTGSPGTGKTTLINDLLDGFSDAEVVIARMESTQMQADDLLRSVAYAFNIEAEGLDKATVLKRIRDFLVRQTQIQRRALLIVDEAQDLPSPAIEELRLLTNLQFNNQPLLQVFMLGQEQLRDVVRTPSLEQFHQRLIAACHLRPLEADETRDYVESRLKRVEWSGDPSISNDAFHLIHHYTEGVPRRINQLCSRLFLLGSLEGKHALTRADVQTAIGELREELLAPWNEPENEPAWLEEGDEVSTEPVPQAQAAPASPSADADDEPSDQEVPALSVAGQEEAELAKWESAAGSVPGTTGLEADTPQIRAEAYSHDDSDESFRAPEPLAAERNEPTEKSGVIGSVHAGTSSAEPDETPSLYAGMRSEPEPPVVAETSSRTGKAIAVVLTVTAILGGVAFVASGQKWPGANWFENTFAPSTNVADTTSTDSESGRPRPSASGKIRTAGEAGGEARQVATAVVEEKPAPTQSEDVATATSAPKAPAASESPGGEPPQDSTPTSMESGATVAGESLEPEPESNTEESDQGGDSSKHASGEADKQEQSPLILQLESTLREKGLDVQRLEGETLKLTTEGELSFEFDSTVLKPGFRNTLATLAQMLQGHGQKHVEIIGYTDDTGPEEYNLLLSRRRARAVADYLISQGMDPERLQTEGRGSATTVASSGDPRAQRRVEIYLR